MGRFTMTAKSSLVRAMVAAFGVLSVMVLVGGPGDSVSAASCKDGYYAVAGYDANGYGVRAKLLVTDPSTVCMWSNQVAVYLNVDNWVEGGWQKSPFIYGNSGKHPWTYGRYKGVGESEYFGAYSLSAGSDYTFKFVSKAAPGGGGIWDFYFGSTKLHSWYLPSTTGQVHAQQERWNHADGQVDGAPQGQSHLWALKKANIDRQFVNWSYLDGHDYDADYRYFEYASDNTQFWVYPD